MMSIGGRTIVLINVGPTGIIEKSAVDGQKTYHRDLETAMRQYIKEHATEFQVEGDDDEAVAADTVVEPVTT